MIHSGLVDPAYNLSHLNIAEILFIVWSIGFALDEFASLYENGSSVYFYGAFNVLDSLYCLIFFVYLGMRVHALVGGASVDPDKRQLAFDVLSLAGCSLAPRLMVSLIPDHVVVMALGRMARQFASVASLCSRLEFGDAADELNAWSAGCSWFWLRSRRLVSSSRSTLCAFSFRLASVADPATGSSLTMDVLVVRKL